ncbi:MAG: PorV/PorQ family protein, partial [Bacteroidota bacterium]|nr:PorV/PorQ family protein [Bacteroidota bacterium]
MLVLPLAFIHTVAQTPAAFQFLRTVASPRSAALANATVALPGDEGAQLLNPAIGATLTGKTLTSAFLKHVLDINAGAVSYTGIPWWNGRSAVTVVYMDYGTFDRRTSSGQPLGQFSAHDVALAFYYSDTLEPRLLYGLAPKLVWERLESQNAWVLAVDAGLLYLFPDGRTSVGIALLHAGTALRRFTHEPLPLPTDLRVGLTHFLQGLPAVFNLGFIRLVEPTPSVWQKFENFVVGIELQFGSAVQLRIGYDNLLRRAAPSGQRGVTGVSLGAGVTASDIRVDYSTTLVSAALLHRLGVQIGM